METIIGFIVIFLVLWFLLGFDISFILTFLAVVIYIFKTFILTQGFLYYGLPSIGGLLIIYFVYKKVTGGVGKKKIEEKSEVEDEVKAEDNKNKECKINNIISFKKSDDGYVISGVGLDAKEGLLTSIVSLVRNIYDVGEIFIGTKEEEKEKHIICIKNGDHFETVILKTTDNKFIISSSEGKVFLEGVLQKLAYDGNVFCVDFSWLMRSPRLAGDFFLLIKTFNFTKNESGLI